MLSVTLTITRLCSSWRVRSTEEEMTGYPSLIPRFPTYSKKVEHLVFVVCKCQRYNGHITSFLLDVILSTSDIVYQVSILLSTVT